MFQRKRTTEDFAEEIQAHIELEAEELRREGLSEEDSRWQARRKFDNARATQEQFYMRGRWLLQTNCFATLSMDSALCWRAQGSPSPPS